MEIQRIVVVGGGGLMGSGIAQVVAQAGFQVTIVEVDDAALERGLARIERSLERLVTRDVTSTRPAPRAARLARRTDLEAAAAEADHVIETRRRGPRR